MFQGIFSIRKTDTQIGQIYGGFSCLGFVVGLALGAFVIKRREWPRKYTFLSRAIEIRI